MVGKHPFIRRLLRSPFCCAGLAFAALTAVAQPVHAAAPEPQPNLIPVTHPASPDALVMLALGPQPVQTELPADPAALLANGKAVAAALGPIAIPPPAPTPAALVVPPSRAQAIGLTLKALDDFGSIAPGCGLAAHGPEGQGGAVTCPFADASTGLTIGSRLGGFETHATFARGVQSPWTSQSLLSGDRRGLGDESTVAMVGFSGTLLDNRVTVKMDRAWSSSWQTPLYAQPFPLRDRNERTGSAGWYGVEAKLAQSPIFSWSVAADYGNVGQGFFIGQGAGLMRMIALPGEQLTLSSTFKVRQTRITLSNDRYRTDFGNSTSSRLGIAANGISLRLIARDFESGAFAGFAAYSTRSHSLMGSIDLSVDSASSGLLADLGRSPLFPRTLSLSWRNGWIENSLPTALDRFRRDAWSLSAGWETKFGETTLDYSQDRRIGAAAQLGTKADESVELSHMVRWSGWRAGVDAMVTRSASSNARGYRQTSYSAGSTIAYQRVDGPEFMLRIGRDRDRMRLNDRSYLSANDGFRLSASLDLTAYLNKQFDRKDLRLRIEYRKLLEGRNENVFDPELALFDRLVDRLDRNVFQLSFGMKL